TPFSLPGQRRKKAILASDALLNSDTFSACDKCQSSRSKQQRSRSNSSTVSSSYGDDHSTLSSYSNSDSMSPMAPHHCTDCDLSRCFDCRLMLKELHQQLEQQQHQINRDDQNAEAQ